MGRSRIRDGKTTDGAARGGQARSTGFPRRGLQITRLKITCLQITCLKITHLQITRPARAVHHMVHRRVRHMLEIYAAGGGLGSENEHLVEKHVAECATCARNLREILDLAASLRAMPFAEPSLKPGEIVANALARSRAAGDAAASGSTASAPAAVMARNCMGLQRLWWAEYAVLVAGFVISLTLVAPRVWLPVGLLRPGLWTIVSQGLTMFVAALPVVLLWGIRAGIRRLREEAAF